MSKSQFWMAYTPFALVALIAGWMIGTPKSSGVVDPRPAAASSLQTAPSPAADAWSASGATANAAVPDGSADALKGRLTSSLDQVEASPCDAAVRAAFLDAYADRSGAIADAASAGNGDRPPEWNTAIDTSADQRIQQLIKAGYFTQDEVGMAVVQRRMGRAFVAQQMQREHTPSPMHSARCPVATG